MTEPIFADNCQACGQEFLSIQLIPIKLGSISLPRIKICMGCLVQNDIQKDYKFAANILKHKIGSEDEFVRQVETQDLMMLFAIASGVKMDSGVSLDLLKQRGFVDLNGELSDDGKELVKVLLAIADN